MKELHVRPGTAVRGYGIVYRENETNHCPGCGRTHWYVGRLSAECGFCGTALPLAAATSPGIGARRSGARVIGPFEPLAA
jgi:hypothetical protein